MDATVIQQALVMSRVHVFGDKLIRFLLVAGVLRRRNGGFRLISALIDSDGTRR